VLEDAPDLRGSPCRSCRRARSHARRCRRGAARRSRAGPSGTSPSNGQPKRWRSAADRGLRALATCMTARSFSIDRRSHVDVARLWLSLAERTVWITRRRVHGRGPRLVVGHERRVARARTALIRRHHRLGSASCGTTLGGTKEVTCIPLHAGRGQEVHRLDLLLGRDESGSIWTHPGSHFTNFVFPNARAASWHLQTPGVPRTLARRRANLSRAGDIKERRRPR